MYGAGYRSITNVDYSSVCIETMSARHRDCPGMTWHEMDISRLSFPDASFDVVLEKATLDALLVEEESPWEVSPHTASFLHQSLTEVRASPPTLARHRDRFMLSFREIFLSVFFISHNFHLLFKSYITIPSRSSLNQV